MNLVAPTYDLGIFYGAYLLFTLACTYHVLYKWKKESLKEDQKFSKWKDNWPKIFAFVIVVGLYWFQNEYRFQYSLEASAKNTLNNLFNAWEVGEKEEVINTFERLSEMEKPWDPEPASYSDEY